MGRKAKDLTGMKFGELVAIKPVDGTKNGIIWECKCSCGNIVNVLSSRLLSGKTKSCGHLTNESKTLRETIGKKFGRLTIISAGSQKRKCICKCDCGTEKELYLSNVLSGKTKSCGCLQKEAARNALEIDFTGLRFGRWLVIGKSEDGSRCKCRCDCGTIKDVDKQSLKNGDSISCGCYKREFTSNLMTKDLSGQKFGRLLVVDRAGSCVGSDGSKCATWNCICDCGNKVIVKGIDMMCGKVSSCGCLISKGEFLMRQELLRRGVSFKTQYSFFELKSDKGRTLRFDFAIIKNDTLLCLIEYQGIQHDKKYEKYHNKFGEQQREITDELKKTYCVEHDIPLFEIWYNQNIDVELDKILQSINYK